MGKKQTLTMLERARTHGHRLKKPVTTEEIEVALAWMRGEIHLGQVVAAYGDAYQSGNVLYRVAVCLREAHRNGQLHIGSIKDSAHMSLRNVADQVGL